MQVVHKTIQYTRPDQFAIYPLGDIHGGVIHCDEDLLKAKVREIKSNPNAYWLGMGDYCDLVTPSDFKRWEGKILAPWMKDEEDNIGPAQMRHMNDILKPIWGQCLGLIEGNHDDSIRKHTHYDFMKELLREANKKGDVPYAGVQCLLVLKFVRSKSGETHDYIIHARHGEGAARTSGARANAVLRLASTFVNAHITFMGHLHGQESPDIPQRLIYKDGKIKSFETIAVMTGAWLKGYMQDVPACYVERWGCTPSVLGCPHVIITPDDNKMELVKSRVVTNMK